MNKEIEIRINQCDYFYTGKSKDPVYESYLKEYVSLDKWFNTYDNQVKQYERCTRLGIAYDNKYGTIQELDNQAVEKSARMSELYDLIINYK